MLEPKTVSLKTYPYPLINNIVEYIHRLPMPVNDPNSNVFLIRGNFHYFHYGCDLYKDHGWGCAYRSLQSMISWILHRRNKQNEYYVPSIREIQQTLVNINDKSSKHVGSSDWIGALEICYVIDSIYNVPCKIIHIKRCETFHEYFEILLKYFQIEGGFVMMGGDVDASSKGIIGVHKSSKGKHLLVVDPHFSGIPVSVQQLFDKGYIRWQNINEFLQSSFYNLCLPMLKA